MAVSHYMMSNMLYHSGLGYCMPVFMHVPAHLYMYVCECLCVCVCVCVCVSVFTAFTLRMPLNPSTSPARDTRFYKVCLVCLNV